MVYIIVENDSVQDQVDEVNKNVKEGFDPFGSMTVLVSPEGLRCYIQPMVKL